MANTADGIAESVAEIEGRFDSESYAIGER
jgi:hypothetical protein